MSGYGPIKHFTDIEVWKLARKLRQEIYKITKSLPAEEKYDLGSQMRRASVSVTANLAEGFGRFHFQENIQFCRLSRGSLYEIQDHVITCYDEKFIPKQQFDCVYNLIEQTAKTLNGYIRWLRKQKLENN